MICTSKPLKTNDFWKKNIALFLARFSSLAEMLNISATSLKSENPDIFSKDFEVFPSKKGVLTAKYSGKMIHSMYDPQREAETIAKSAKKDGISACAFLGFGLGYAPDAYARLFPNDTIILIEPDPALFFSALCFFDFSRIFACENLIFAIGAGADVASRIIESAGGLEKCAVVKNSARCASSAYFAALESQLERNREKDSINKATFARFEKIWNRNIKKNCAFLEKQGRKICAASDFFGKYSGKPFLILAAGPTLFDFLPHLDKIKDKITIVCVDTALRFCIKANVQPDFIVITDPQYAAFKHIAGFSSKKSVLITEIDAYPSVFHFDADKIALCAANCPLNLLGFSDDFVETDKKRGILRSGGSVSTTAWDFARLCGASEIFFAGLDLGFPFGRTHIKGSTFEEEMHSISTRVFNAETRQLSILFGANILSGESYSGEKILTDNRMKMFAWWFEGKAAEFANLPTYSLSEKSLKIPGFKTISIEDFLKKTESKKH